jgi:hypothetical protein
MVGREADKEWHKRPDVRLHADFVVVRSLQNQCHVLLTLCAQRIYSERAIPDDGQSWFCYAWLRSDTASSGATGGL